MTTEQKANELEKVIRYYADEFLFLGAESTNEEKLQFEYALNDEIAKITAGDDVALSLSINMAMQFIPEEALADMEDDEDE